MRGIEQLKEQDLESLHGYREIPSRLRKNYRGPRNIDSSHVWLNRETISQGAQKGRSARPQRAKMCGGTNRTSCGPFTLEWILANGKAPTVLPTSEKLLLNVEPLSEARTKLADFFSILLGQ